MKEHPIIFSGEMVRAIMDGRKTQTRRVIKLAPCWFKADGKTLMNTKYYKGEDAVREIKWPGGMPGDRLWVRETLRRFTHARGVPDTAQYVADITAVPFREGCWSGYCGTAQWQWPKRDVIPSIHMPRWASRIALEIVSVRVERLQEITVADAQAEGVGYRDVAQSQNRAFPVDYIKTFANLWDSINAKRGHGWDTNPFVWVIEFKRL